MATSRETLAKKPDLIRRAMRAMTAAMVFAHANPEETAKIMRPYFPDLDEAVFKQVVETYRKASASTPVITKEQIEKTVAWMNIGAKSPFSAKFEDVADDKIAKDAVASLKK